jgi:hypothetical protein
LDCVEFDSIAFYIKMCSLFQWPKILDNLDRGLSWSADGTVVAFYAVNCELYFAYLKFNIGCIISVCKSLFNDDKTEIVHCKILLIREVILIVLQIIAWLIALLCIYFVFSQYYNAPQPYMYHNTGWCFWIWHVKFPWS